MFFNKSPKECVYLYMNSAEFKKAHNHNNENSSPFSLNAMMDAFNISPLEDCERLSAIILYIVYDEQNNQLFAQNIKELQATFKGQANKNLIKGAVYYAAARAIQKDYDPHFDLDYFATHPLALQILTPALTAFREHPSELGLTQTMQQKAKKVIDLLSEYMNQS